MCVPQKYIIINYPIWICVFNPITNLKKYCKTRNHSINPKKNKAKLNELEYQHGATSLLAVIYITNIHIYVGTENVHTGKKLRPQIIETFKQALAVFERENRYTELAYVYVYVCERMSKQEMRSDAVIHINYVPGAYRRAEEKIRDAAAIQKRQTWRPYRFMAPNICIRCTNVDEADVPLYWC